MVKKKDKTILEKLLESGIPQEVIKGFFQMIGMIASSMAANPMSAIIGGTTILGLLEVMGLVPKAKADMAFSAILGLASADAISDIATIIPSLGAKDMDSYPNTYAPTLIFSGETIDQGRLDGILKSLPEMIKEAKK